MPKDSDAVLPDLPPNNLGVRRSLHSSDSYFPSQSRWCTCESVRRAAASRQQLPAFCLSSPRQLRRSLRMAQTWNQSFTCFGTAALPHNSPVVSHQLIPSFPELLNRKMLKKKTKKNKTWEVEVEKKTAISVISALKQCVHADGGD